MPGFLRESFLRARVDWREHGSGNVYGPSSLEDEMVSSANGALYANLGRKPLGYPPTNGPRSESPIYSAATYRSGLQPSTSQRLFHGASPHAGIERAVGA